MAYTFDPDEFYMGKTLCLLSNLFTLVPITN